MIEISMSISRGSCSVHHDVILPLHAPALLTVCGNTHLFCYRDYTTICMYRRRKHLDLQAFIAIATKAIRVARLCNLRSQ